ncbi:MAG: response regulator [Epsilonproteobacteria bacterium]|nr:response regulator [Campylobacterota bacterium]
MNGEIHLESKEGIASTFTLSIELHLCKDAKQKRSISTSGEDGASKHYQGRVLVAEENKTNQMLIALLLKEYDLHVTIAEDGKEAFEAFKSSRFDLVLMDENMPYMTGIESLRHIREHEKLNNLSKTPIVALSANVMQEDQKHFLEAGMDDFLAKPIESGELERVLRRFLEAL